MVVATKANPVVAAMVMVAPICPVLARNQLILTSSLESKFTRQGDTIELKQTGLINKIIKTTGMQDANGKPTPAKRHHQIKVDQFD